MPTMDRAIPGIKPSQHWRIATSRNSKILLLVAILLSGCSNRQIYTAIQLNRQFECSKLPVQEQQACEEEYSESYDSYQRARAEASGGS